MNTITQKEMNKMNVKPKFLKIMKQRIFTLVMMLALVIVTSSAFAQSTPTAANVGATHTYSVGGLDDADVWTFIVSAPADNLQDGDVPSEADGTEFDFVNTNTGTAPTAATVDIKWLVAGSYRLWIKVTDEGALGCANYRFVDVTVTDNQFNAVIIALGTGDNNTGSVAAFTEDVLACPKFVGEEFDDENTDTEGSTYVYFKVTRTVAVASTSNWAFTPTISGTGAVTAWHSSVDGAAWSAVTTISDEFIVNDATGTTDNVWFRATVTNATEASPAKTVIFNFGTTAYEVTGGAVDQDDSGSNTATQTLEKLPAIGNFSF